jgi:hypothetical protein
MGGPRVAAPMGGSALPFCERCGNLIGPVATLLRIGLSMCPSCGVYACDRCWTRATGACPGCGISAGAAAGVGAAATAGVSAAAAMSSAATAEIGAASRRLHNAWRAPIVIAAVGTAVLAASVLAFTIGGRNRPAGDLQLALGALAALTSPTPGYGQSPESSFFAAAVPTPSEVALSPTPTATPQIPSPDPTLPSSPPQLAPTPGATPA